MAHFAKINQDNLVTQVIVIDNVNSETEQMGKDFILSIGLEGNWVQTSYNANFRGKFAGEGDFYDESSDKFITLFEKSRWLTLAGKDYIKNNSEKTILVDGFPRSGNVYLSYLLGFGFKNCYQYTGYNFLHNKESITEATSKFDLVVTPVRLPIDSIKSSIIYFGYNTEDTQSIFELASDNLEWMKIIKTNKDKICVVDFTTLISNSESVINKISSYIEVLPSEFTDQEVIDRMNQDNMSYNLPNDVTSNADIDLSNPLIAEVIEEATAIYNEIIG